MPSPTSSSSAAGSAASRRRLAERDRGDQCRAGHLEQQRQADHGRAGRAQHQVEQRVPEQLRAERSGRAAAARSSPLKPPSCTPPTRQATSRASGGGRVAERGVRRGADRAAHLGARDRVERRRRCRRAARAGRRSSARGVQREVDARQHDDADQRDRDAQPGPARHVVPRRPGDQRDPDRLGRHDARSPRPPRCSAGSAPRSRSAAPAAARRRRPSRTLAADQCRAARTPGDAERDRARSPRSREHVAPHRHGQRGRRDRPPSTAPTSTPRGSPTRHQHDVGARWPTDRARPGSMRRRSPVAHACRPTGILSRGACGTLGTVIVRTGTPRWPRAGRGGLPQVGAGVAAADRRPSAGRRSPWHVWVDGAVHVVTGGLEQPLPDLADGAEVDVIARSKDTVGPRRDVPRHGHDRVAGDDAWEPVGPELHAKRLNPPRRRGAARPVGPRVPVVRMEPTGRLVERPGTSSHGSHAAEPVRRLPPPAATCRSSSAAAPATPTALARPDRPQTRPG